MACSLELKASGPRRAVAFLVCPDNSRVNVQREFGRLDNQDERRFRARFDNWVQSIKNDSHYHGWNNSQYGVDYSECFVFKSVNHRLYGYLCHPKPYDLRFEACVLVLHAFKNEWRTDSAELDRVKSLSNSLLVWP